MLISALLLRFKANYLDTMRGYPYFSLWIQIALAKIYTALLPRSPNLAQKPLHLVGIVLKTSLYITLLGTKKWHDNVIK